MGIEVLHAEGKVETRQVGAAKVYWISQRVPMSAFLCFTKNMFIILDLNMNIVQVNDQYLTFPDYPRKISWVKYSRKWSSNRHSLLPSVGHKEKIRRFCEASPGQVPSPNFFLTLMLIIFFIHP